MDVHVLQCQVRFLKCEIMIPYGLVQTKVSLLAATGGGGGVQK